MIASAGIINCDNLSLLSSPEPLPVAEVVASDSSVNQNSMHCMFFMKRDIHVYFSLLTSTCILLSGQNVIQQVNVLSSIQALKFSVRINNALLHLPSTGRNSQNVKC